MKKQWTKLPMDERKAWLYLAKAWSKARKGSPFYYPDCGEFAYACGLCVCISRMHDAGKISSQTARDMLRKVCTAMLANDSPYFPYAWDRRAKGARQRAAFCRKQASAMKPPTKRKKPCRSSPSTPKKKSGSPRRVSRPSTTRRR